MRCALAILFIFSIANSIASLPAKNEIRPRIIDGKVARAGQFPWQVAIELNAQNGLYFCGGSLISDQWILTTAHCVHMGRLLTLHMGTNSLTGHETHHIIATTSNYIEHPLFNPYTLENDIGLIKLHMKVTLNEYVQPVALADFGQIDSGTRATVAGWGQISDANAGEVDELMYADLVLISSEECKVYYGDYLKSNMVCAVGNLNEGICIGDTGGPLVANIETEPTQLAVATFVSQAGCESAYPSGFTRVDIYKEWILNVTRIDV